MGIQQIHALCLQNSDQHLGPLLQKWFDIIEFVGAIGNCLTESQFMIGDSTNSTQFQSFMQQVLSNMKKGVHRPLLVLDNAGAHRANANKQFL